MERLRAPDGCPWDREQTFATIAPYTIEESYEVADAIQRGDIAHLKEELGDLLFQVVFHARIAEESGHFDFDAVAAAIRDKLIRRHPLVFGNPSPEPAQRPTAAAQSAAWEDIKARERAAASTSAIDGIPLALPALMRAFKLSKRAARVGFDFTQASESADKVAEELAEVREAAALHEAAALQEVAALHEAPADGGAESAAAVFEEIGDLLFAAANLARKLDVDAEAALQAANAKFERRFRGMERLAAEQGRDFESLNLAAQEALWQAVKRGESG